MEIIKLRPYSMFGTNSYIIHDGERAALIDAPGNNAEAEKALADNGLRPEKILLTHGHCDHITGLAGMVSDTGAEVFIHEADKSKLSDAYYNLTEYFGLPAIPKPDGKITTVNDGDEIMLGDIVIKVMHTPGHTKGSVMYIAEDVIFSGDTIFCGSIGRTDMPDGDMAAMEKSLKNVAAFVGDHSDYRILAGHGGETTLNREKSTNPYMLYGQY